MVSSQNCRFLAAHNPNWVINGKNQLFKKVNVYFGIFNKGFVGLLFLDNPTGQIYMIVSIRC